MRAQPLHTIGSLPMSGNVIWGVDFSRGKPSTPQEDYDLFCEAWKAVRAELDALVDLEVIYESPSVAERLHEVELPSDCEPS